MNVYLESRCQVYVMLIVTTKTFVIDKYIHRFSDLHVRPRTGQDNSFYFYIDLSYL